MEEFHGNVRNGGIKMSCKAQIRSHNGVFDGRTNEHTCTNLPNPAEVAVRKARNAMQIQAETTEDRTQAIIGGNVQQLSAAEKAQLPNLETMRRGIRRARQGDIPVAPQPANHNLVIPPAYSTLENGDAFLQYDNNNAERISIFGTDDGLNFLAHADDWFMDGTFTVAPPQFAQLYTVHGLSADHLVVCCYALLPNKRRGTYVEFLQQVHRLTNGFIPQSIMIDFEQACIGAIPIVYPNTFVFGCLFHLSKSIFRHVQANGLQLQYSNDAVFRENIRMIPALAFVPIADTQQSFNALAQHCVGNEQGILDYFETNYIGEFRRGRWRDPLFPHVLWNIHHRVTSDLPRTNNALEGWHRQFNDSISVAHPTIWTFIKVLRREAAIQQIRVGHFIAGRPAPAQRRVYRDVNDRIKNIVNDYPNRPIIDYLRGISYNLSA